MIDISKVRSCYTKFYQTLVCYTWNINTIQTLSELEVYIFTSFPDVDKMRSKLRQLKMCIMRAYNSDEDVKKSFDALESTLDNDDEVFVNLGKVQEVIVR